MNSPFVYGKIVTGSSFINRAAEIARLSGNFRNKVNTILISPRRWGKSSLVNKTASLVSADNPGTWFCFLDLFRIRSEEDFYRRYATEVIKSSPGKLDDWITNVKDFLGRLSPSLSFGPDPVNDFQLSFNLSKAELDVEEILNLPEKLAIRKKKQIVVCIDEFQNIGTYSENLEFQKLLRSVWQHHQHVSYCIYGSKRHMMMELFEQQTMPFYKFGDIMFLQKIESIHFVEFIADSFMKTGKSIESLYCQRLVDQVEAHPYFVQQLAHILWSNTSDNVSEDIFNDSLNELINQNSILYQQIAGELSHSQLNFLIALSQGASNLNSMETMKKFDLGTSGNVTKIKKVLISKEIIDVNDGRISFSDPVFRRWLLRTF